MALSVAGLLWPALMRLIFVAWMAVAYPIGWTISHLVFLVIFFLVIAPIGLVMRLLSGDPLVRRFNSSAPTYWVAHNPGGNTARYLRQF